VTRAIGPSPARAQPHDAASWLPVPDPHALPTIEVLLEHTSHLDARGDVIDAVALEAHVMPSPARAEPHDAAAWLPLPDVHVLPPVEALIDPDPVVQAAVIAEAEAVVLDALVAAEAAVAPSPARAEPHDPSSWLPLPSVESLVPVGDLVDAPASSRARIRSRRFRRFLPRSRVVFAVLLVVATVAAGGWITGQLLAPGGSKVSLLVDGTRSQFRTDVKTVGAVLALHHVHLGAGDVVVPPATSSLHDGLRIDILRSFPVTVDLDGVVRTVRTTERSTEALAKQMKLGKLVAVRSGPTRLQAGSEVVYRTRIGGSLDVDGQMVTFDSPSRTVDELLQSYKVNLVGDDYVLPTRDTVISDGVSVKVVRVGATTVQVSKPIPFPTLQQPDDHLPIGQTRVVKEGKDGVATQTYRERVENGAAGERTLLSEVPSVAPQPKVIAYGTYADPHWDELAQCESGGRWDTVDQGPDGYDGGLGIYRGTWRAFGGTEFAPNAGLATREQQIIVGMRIYAALGWDPWGCANNVLHWPNRTS
jgi:resuscitation-promoting factor RpfB